MTKLYTKYAKIYHEMYQSIFDYKEDFKLFHKILEKLKCKKILELGCGSGNLAPYFTKAGYDYTGLDIAEEMLDIAKRLNPNTSFVCGDMRNLNLKESYEAIIITGRSFCYMTTNDDVMRALSSINQALAENGWLIFDNFDANIIFLGVKEKMLHESQYGNRFYRRTSTTRMTLEHGWTWDWHAIYEVEQDGKKETFEDDTILRAFTEDELGLYLKMNGYKIREVIQEDPGIVIVAQKSEIKQTIAEKNYFVITKK